MKFANLLATAVLALAIPALAQAATVAIGTTQVGDTGGINAVGTVSTLSSNSAYYSGPAAPGSAWVWSGNSRDVDAATYTFSFDLTGYDLSTAALSGLWGVDNTGTISLNGNLIASLGAVITANFNNLNSYGTTTPSFFTAGLNTLRFDLRDAGGQAAFRATGLVTADLSPVPLPASALLLLGGLGGIAAFKRRKAVAA